LEKTKPLVLKAEADELIKVLDEARSLLPRGFAINDFIGIQDILALQYRDICATSAMIRVVVFKPSEILKVFVSALRTTDFKPSRLHSVIRRARCHNDTIAPDN